MLAVRREDTERPLQQYNLLSATALLNRRIYPPHNFRNIRMPKGGYEGFRRYSFA